VSSIDVLDSSTMDVLAGDLRPAGGLEVIRFIGVGFPASGSARMNLTLGQAQLSQAQATHLNDGAVAASLPAVQFSSTNCTVTASAVSCAVPPGVGSDLDVTLFVEQIGAATFAIQDPAATDSNIRTTYSVSYRSPRVLTVLGGDASSNVTGAFFGGEGATGPAPFGGPQYLASRGGELISVVLMGGGPTSYTTASASGMYASSGMAGSGSIEWLRAGFGDVSSWEANGGGAAGGVNPTSGIALSRNFGIVSITDATAAAAYIRMDFDRLLDLDVEGYGIQIVVLRTPAGVGGSHPIHVEAAA